MEFKTGLHYSTEIESAILGACLLESDAFGRTFGLLEKDNFYLEGNKVIYESLAEMYSEGMKIDTLVVFDYLLNTKKVNEISNSNIGFYLSKLTNSVVSTAHLEFHCFLIKRMWMERELIKLTHGGLVLKGETSEQIIQITKQIEKINTGILQDEWSSMRDIMMGLAKHQDKMLTTKGMGLSTSITKLDEANGGLFGGMLIVIGARPSVGKSALMGQMALSMARNKKNIGIISLEMNNNEIAARLSSIETQTDFKTIFRNLFEDENSRGKWYNKMNNFIDHKIYISDRTGVTASNIKAKAQKLKHQINGLDCLFIDYLQLVSAEGSSKFNNRENEVSQISRTCKLIAKDLNIPVIILCQLNREVTKRTGKNRYPQLSDLRESGSIEQDADAVLFLHRDWITGIQEYMYDENGNSKINHADLIVRKWRNGESNLHIELEFDAPKMRFIEKNSYTFSPVELADKEIEENPF